MHCAMGSAGAVVILDARIAAASLVNAGNGNTIMHIKQAIKNIVDFIFISEQAQSPVYRIPMLDEVELNFTDCIS